MSRKQVTFQCGDLTLQGVLSVTEGQASGPAVVVCHPHPLYGGDMYNNVVIEVCRELEAKEIASLRFNFRGTGGSSGSHAQGIGEQDDVRSAISFLEGLAEIHKERIGVAGYSFGAGVGTRVAVADRRVKAFVAISLPPRLVDIPLLQSCTKPKMFISGSDDNLVPASELQKLVETLPDPKRCLIIKGVDHFWLDGIEDAAKEAAEFFSRVL